MTHPDLDRFEQLYRLADRLVAEASKAELAEAARILALNLARYQATCLSGRLRRMPKPFAG